VSCSFTLVREDALEAIAARPLVLSALDPAARIELIAAQIATYGEDQPDVGAEVLTWARATTSIAGAVDLLGVRVTT
jgi:hypothetical protein